MICWFCSLGATLPPRFVSYSLLVLLCSALLGCGLVWFVVVRCGLVRFGEVWCGVVCCGSVWFGADHGLACVSLRSAEFDGGFHKLHLLVFGVSLHRHQHHHQHHRRRRVGGEPQ